MKRVLTLCLALLTLIAATARAEYIGGDGWWDDGYEGDWQYSYDGGLYFKLPYDWGDDFGDDSQMLFCRNDYTVTLRVCTHPGTMWDVEDRIEANGCYWDGFQYNQSANIILKGDRDWYIIASSYAMCAFTGGLNGNTVEFSFSFEEEEACRAIVRRIISSVE